MTDTDPVTGAAAGRTAASRSSTRRIMLGIVGGALVLAAVFLLGRATAPTDEPPTSTSAEAGFARDMQTHHQQAVEMSLIVRDRTTEPDVRLLAFDIATTQQQQSGQMFAWLRLWGLPQASPEPEMTWMTRPTLEGATHDGHTGDDAGGHRAGEPMPGLASPEQIAELTAASGVEAERLFLELMIAHHRGGVEMARALLDRSTHPVVTGLAKGMVSAQQSEIDYMQGLLDARS